jgi:hypothetical protein
MANLRKRALSRNHLRAVETDLFSWRPVPVLNSAPLAVRKLAQRYGITVPHAITVARLAGLGGSEVRQ